MQPRSVSPPPASALSRRLRRLGGSLLTTGLLGSLGLASTLHADPHATGLRPLTEADLAWRKANSEVPKEVRLNTLAVQRINAERKAQGLAPLSTAGVAIGKEVIPNGAREAKARAESSTAAVVTKDVALPVTVDNSLLPSFPPVMSQGSIGSCASFTTVYYSATHMVGLARGTNNKNPATAVIFSAKWSYTMTNGGADAGGTSDSIYPFLQRNGCATLQDVPYSGEKTESSFLPWSIEAGTYRRALSYRMDQAGVIQLVNDDGTLNAANLTQVKTLLANGYVFYFGSDIGMWNYVNIKKDPASTQDGTSYVGKPGCVYVAPGTGDKPEGHAMNIVGYSDDVWLDINGNGKVDPGEKGAFRICNSWGNDWAPDSKQPANQDGGLTWLSYDALLKTSAVAGAPAVPTRRFAFDINKNSVNYLTARKSYTPKLIGQFTLNSASREELNVSVGTSATTATAPTAIAPTGAVTTTVDLVYGPDGFSIQDANGKNIGKGRGGKFGFLGTTAAVNGDFAFDLSDVVTDTSTLQRYYLSLGDDKTGNPSQALSFVLTDAAGNLLTQPGQAVNAPATADNSTQQIYVDYVTPAGTAQPVVNSALTAAATAGMAFTYQIAATNNPTSFGAANLPAGLTVNPATGLISGTPATAATFTVGLSANSAGGTGSAALVLTVAAPAGSTVPVFGSPTVAAATVGQPFSYQIAAAPAAQSFTLDGTIPVGLTFNPATGVLAGTPMTAGKFTLTLGATNASGSNSQVLTLTIAGPAATVGLPVFTSPGSVETVAGDVFSYRSAATNRPTSYAAMDLPDGLSINPANGVISGRTPTARSYTVVVSATNATGTGYLTLIIVAAGNDFSAPTNNDLSDAIDLRSANPAVTTGANARATSEAGEPTHGGQPAVQSVWYKWTSPSTGAATFDTTGSNFKTIVEVYTGTTYADVKSLGASNGDGSLPVGIVTIPVTAGTTYTVAIDSNQFDRGTIALKISAPTDAAAQTRPANDDFANRITLAKDASVSVTGENLNATAEAGEPVPPDQTATGNTVWYTYTPTAAGQLTIDTADTEFDTILSAYTGGAVNALTLVGSNDQNEDEGDNTSKLTIPVVEGVPVQIAVSGFEGDAGAFNLNVNLAVAAPVTVAITPTRPLVYSSVGKPAVFRITRTAGDQTLPIRVGYQVLGTAEAADFQPLPGFVTLEPNQMFARIKVFPINRGAGVGGQVSVRVKLTPDANYTFNGKLKGKVIIVRDGK